MCLTVANRKQELSVLQVFMFQMLTLLLRHIEYSDCERKYSAFLINPWAKSQSTTWAIFSEVRKVIKLVNLLLLKDLPRCAVRSHSVVN